MAVRCRVLAVLALLALMPAGAWAQVGGFITGNTPAETAAWRRALPTMVGAPGKVDVAGQATMRMSGNLFFIPSEQAAAILQARHQDVEDLAGIILDSNASNWFIVVRYLHDGFVPVDDIRSWSMPQLLGNIANQVEDDTEATAAPKRVRGWLLPPLFDPAQHSLIWAVQVVPRNATPNENGEATFHAAMFGREGYILMDMNAVVDHPDGQQEDAAAILSSLRFNDGLGYAAFNPATDPVALHGLPGVFGLATLQPLPWMRKVWRSNLLVPATTGVVLVAGACTVFLIQLRITRARNRREI